MSLTCTQPGFAAVVPGSLRNMAPKIKQALMVLYLYRQKNPDTVGQAIPAASLLDSAKCLECGPSDDLLNAFEVWIERQAAIDAGSNVGSFNSGDAMREINCLKCYSMHELHAIEILLRCQLS